MASMQPMSAGELADSLVNAAMEQAAARGRQFSSSNIETLQHMAQGAAAELLAGTPDVDAIVQAYQDFRRFVDYAVDAAESFAAEGYPTDLLGERTLEAALRRFCPCPPFCR